MFIVNLQDGTVWCDVSNDKGVVTANDVDLPQDGGLWA